MPSQPSTPKTQVEQPPTDSSVNIENGVEALSLEDTPQVSTLPDSLMPAPSMVVRSTPQKQTMHMPSDVTPPTSEGVQQSQSYNQQAAFPPQGVSASNPQIQSVPPNQTSPPLAGGAGFQTEVTNSQQHPLLGGVYNVAPPTATQSTTLPGASTVPYSMPAGGSHGYMQATPTVQATPAMYSAPQMTGTYPSSASSQAATLSGLPTLPPTISLPSVAPTISLGPTPNLISTTNTAQ